MSTVAVQGAILAGIRPRRLPLGPGLAERNVESVFVPLTRLSHSKSEQTAMQPPKHTIIHLIDHLGSVFGRRCLSNTTRLIDLESLRSYGAYRVEVLRTINTQLDVYSTEWAHDNAHKNKNEDCGTAGDAQ